MKFKQLTSKDKDLIKAYYNKGGNKRVIQKSLGEVFGVSGRSVRTWAN